MASHGDRARIRGQRWGTGRHQQIASVRVTGPGGIAKRGPERDGHGPHGTPASQPFPPPASFASATGDVTADGHCTQPSRHQLLRHGLVLAVTIASYDKRRVYSRYYGGWLMCDSSVQ